MSKRTKKGYRTRRRTSRSRRRKKKGGATYLQYLKARYMFNTLAWRFIDKDRMESILENLGIPDDEDTLENAMQAADTNNDDIIDFDEFKVVYDNASEFAEWELIREKIEDYSYIGGSTQAELFNTLSKQVITLTGLLDAVRTQEVAVGSDPNQTAGEMMSIAHPVADEDPEIDFDEFKVAIRLGGLWGQLRENFQRDHKDSESWKKFHISHQRGGTRRKRRKRRRRRRK